MNFVVIILLGTFGMLLLAFSVIGMMMYHQRKVIGHQLILREKDIQQQKERFLSSIQGQEAERKRIAEDLHDEIGALLSCVKLNISQLQKLSPPSTSQNELVGSTKEILDGVIQQVRAISRNLHPSTLTKFGIREALREFADLISKAGTIKATFHTGDNNFPLDKDSELMLFRVIQELCNNIIKYSGDGRLDIYFDASATKLTIMLQDDGKGFSQEEYEQKKESSKSLGLRNIENRLSLINGVIRFNNLSGKGTETTIEIGTSA